ncbi:Putative adhesin [Butyrivibrio sp. INlla18]|uniref:DUF4097 family beta strand repeat-containing protein n=1 Tax=Butyrivibrio sp. INlla18 TaxID=1520806 RepID=UPI0008920D6B|nr:DUF4097 family beta strand repeat-containing protein [Butyrivibrio sp. INlla18]SDA61193.1 Putative adhesin [Butyrivibrio sp. INlla18]
MKHVYSLVLVVLTLAAIAYGYHVHMGGNDKKVDADYEYGADVQKINIEAALMDVEIEEGSEPSITYHGSERLKPTVTYDKGSKILTIKQPNTKVKNAKYNQNNEMTIVLPKDIKLDDFSLNLACGEVTLQKLDAKKIHINDNLGNFEAQRLVSEDIDIDAALGNVKIYSCDAKSVDIDASLGDVEIDMEKDLDKYSISANASLGSMKIGKNSSSSSYVQTGTEGTIMVNCSLGDVEIK